MNSLEEIKLKKFTLNQLEYDRKTQVYEHEKKNRDPDIEFTQMEKAVSDILKQTQSMLEVQFFRNMLMPSQNFQIGKITDKDLQEFMTKETFQRYYIEESAKVKSLVIIDKGRTTERVNPPQKQYRKLFDESDSIYELKDMYRFGEFTLPQINPNRTGIDNSSQCAYLFPQVINADEIMNWDDPQRSVDRRTTTQSFVFPMRENPYFAAELFNTIARNNKLEKGSFFSQELRELLVNLSCYVFQNQHAIDSELEGNSRFYSAFKVFTQSEEFKNSIKDEQGKQRVVINESQLQVVKLLFEGQSRKLQSHKYLRKIFTPVLSKVQVSRVKRRMDQTNFRMSTSSVVMEQQAGDEDYFLNFILSTDSQNQQQPEQTMSDLAFSNNNDFNPLSASMDFSNNLAERSMHQNIMTQRNQNNARNSTPLNEIMNLEDQNYSSQQRNTILTKDFSRRISRVISVERTSVFSDLEPLTGVYTEYQNRELQRAASGMSETAVSQRAYESPECEEVRQELFNTNYLLHDVYAPESTVDIIETTASTNKEEEKEAQVQLFFSAEHSSVLTQTCLEICSKILQQLYQTSKQMPKDIRVMLKLVLSSIDGAFDANTKLINEKVAYVMADLLSGCWLSGGFRWQECFGMSTTLKDEYQLTALLLQSTRLVFEHTLMMKELPVMSKKINGFIIEDINKFIREQKRSVLKFYTSVVDVDVDKAIPVKPQKHYLVKQYFKFERRMFEFVVIRKKDLLVLMEIVLRNYAVFKTKEQSISEAFQMQMNNLASFDRYKARYDHNLFRLQNWLGCNPCNKINQELNPWQEDWNSLTPSQQEQNLHIKREIDRIEKLRKKKNTNLSYGDRLFEEQFIAFVAPKNNFMLTVQNEADEEWKKIYPEICKRYVTRYYNATAVKQIEARQLQKQAELQRQAEKQRLIEQQKLAEQRERNRLPQFNVKNSNEHNDMKDEIQFNIDKRQQVPNSAREENKGPSLAPKRSLVMQDGPRISEVEQDQRLATMTSRPTPRSLLPSDPQEQQKNTADSIQRVLQYLENIFNMPSFNEERLGDLKTAGQTNEGNIDIVQLFQAILEDDKHQADPSYFLQLSSMLIDRYFKELNREMRQNILAVFIEMMNAKIKHSQKRYDYQNKLFGELEVQLSVTQKNIEETTKHLSSVYQAIKFTRFMNMSLNNTKINKQKLLGGDKAMDLSFSKRSMIDKYLSKSFNHQTDSFINAANHDDSLSEIDKKALVTQSVAMPSNIELGGSLLHQMSFDETKIGSMVSNKMENNYAPIKVRDSQPIPTRQKRSISVLEGSDIQIMLSTITSNIIRLFTESQLSDLIVMEIQQELLENMSTDQDYFHFQMCLDLYKKSIKQLIKQPQNNRLIEEEGIKLDKLDSFLEEFVERVKGMILQRVWNILDDTTDPSPQDLALREHFQKKGASYPPPLQDFEDFGFEEEDFVELFKTSVEQLLTINDVYTPLQKSKIIKDALELAHKAYYSFSEDDVSEEIKSKITLYLIAQAYGENEKRMQLGLEWLPLRLHTNLVYILMFGPRGPDVDNSVILLSKALQTRVKL